MQSLRIEHNERTNVFTLTTTDKDGYEHIEMFTVPADAPAFDVCGIDCAQLCRMMRQ